MEILSLAIRLILAAVFGVAGAAKLADLAGSRKALGDFGVPDAVRPLFAVLLPFVEIAIAVSLLFTGFSWFGAVGAVVLLAVFSTGMIVQMIKGNAPDCHCFGQIHSEPVGARSLIRNAVLLVPAVILIAAGGGGQGLSLGNMNAELIQLFAIVVGVALLGAAVYYLHNISVQQTQIIRRIELMELVSRDGGSVEREDAGHPHDGLPIGAVLPNHELKRLDGGIFETGSVTGMKRPSLWFFVSPTCNPCRAMVPQFDEWTGELSDRVSVFFVSSGTAEENETKFETENSKTILLQTGREFAESVHARWTPASIYVDSDGKVASHVASGDTAIGELVEKIKASDLEQPYTFFELGNGHRPGEGVTIGEIVPDFTIDDIDGRTITAGDLRGHSTLLTFWSPTCPHCLNFIDEIKDWDANKSTEDPNLVVFSDGDEEPHRELGLNSTVILDKEYAVAGRLGMHGTPSAVLVNEDGRYASELAVGASNIRALLGKPVPMSKQ